MGKSQVIRQRRRKKIFDMIKELPTAWTPFKTVQQMLGLDRYRATSYLKMAAREGLVEHKNGPWSTKNYCRTNFWRRIQ